MIFEIVLPFLVMYARCEVRVDITYDPHLLSRIPVSFHVANSTELIEGFASLDFNSHQNRLTAFGMPPQSFFEEMNVVDRVTIGDDENSISFPVEDSRMFRATSPAEWDRVRVSLSATFDSPFFAHINDVVITPTSATTGQLILNPENVAEHALFGEWYYTTNIANNQSFGAQIMISVIVGDQSTSSIPAPFLLDMDSESQVLPREAMESFVDSLDQLGFSLSIVGPRHREFSRNHRRGGTDGRPVFITSRSHGYYFIVISGSGNAVDLFESLPTLHFDIHLDNEQMVRVDLLPVDYLKVSEFGEGDFRVLFAADGARPLSIGHSLISKIAIHLDPRNDRIGFADPIAEIQY